MCCSSWSGAASRRWTSSEIEVEYREEFLHLGGKEFSYIHALNDRDAHIEMMRSLVEPFLETEGAPDSE
jgi:ferrochelatase